QEPSMQDRAVSRIALDAMGGDHAPGEIVEGAIMARDELGIREIHVGRRDAVEAELAARGQDPAAWDIVDAPDAVAMNEDGARAIRSKPDASLNVAARLVKDGAAKALVSAGNTGAAMAAALLTWGRIKGIKRPALAMVLPPESRPTILLDVGANADCRPEYLAQFASMGAAYARIRTPGGSARVGLLNIGEEESKGNELARQSHELLAGLAGVDFRGNVEGRDLLAGEVDVIVTDGFTGNVTLKLVEGVAAYITGLVGRALSEAPQDAVMQLLPSLANVKRELDYEETGGAVLLGVKGVCVIGHGSSRAKAAMNAVRVAAGAVRQEMVAEIERALARSGEPAA
ncbi:MAG: phosphate acyltransferase PlsX, partial [Candidatus Geothermincolia bacterium]